MTIYINDEMALSALEAVVAGREDYVYPPLAGVFCLYMGRDCRCIVGEALHYLGVSDEMLELMDLGAGDIAIQEDTTTSIGNIADNSEFALSKGARELFGMAQSQQDNGATWGHALDQARGVLG